MFLGRLSYEALRQQMGGAGVLCSGQWCLWFVSVACNCRGGGPSEQEVGSSNLPGRAIQRVIRAQVRRAVAHSALAVAGHLTQRIGHAGEPPHRIVAVLRRQSLRVRARDDRSQLSQGSDLP